MAQQQTQMQGKVCLITGANSGIGKATALGLARMGATVVMVCRDRARGEEAKLDIERQSSNDAVDLLLTDLSSQQSIKQLAATFQFGPMLIPKSEVSMKQHGLRWGIWRC